MRTLAYIMLVPLFFGFLFVFNLVIGMMTPPVGVVLFVISGVTRVSIPLRKTAKPTQSFWPVLQGLKKVK